MVYYMVKSKGARETKVINRTKENSDNYSRKRTERFLIKARLQVPNDTQTFSIARELLICGPICN